jgi:biopolymer transport protein ExbD
MYTRPKKRQLGQEAIPTTSLADMMFLLLIFFIMTTTLSRVTGFVTDMPAGSKSQEPQQDKTTTVCLYQDRITVNDQLVSMAGLEKHLRGLRLDQRTGDGKVVVVSAAGDVKYQNYYEALAAIQACGGVVAIISEGGEK